MMRVSGWKTIALAILMAGILGGCGGEMIAELEEDLAKVTKESDEYKKDSAELQEKITQIDERERVARSAVEDRIKELEEEKEKLKAQLAAK